jgi:clan AA aspartic protease (TIGR02281 family)
MHISEESREANRGLVLNTRDTAVHKGPIRGMKLRNQFGPLAYLSIVIAIALGYQNTYADAVPIVPDAGTFVVPVLINDRLTLNFTIDSGASDVSIPADVFSTLIRTDTISDSDLLEPAMYTLADGSSRTAQRFRIRSLRIGNFQLHDVVGSVAPVRGALLLGQSFLSRLQTWSIDNQQHLLLINEGVSQPAPGYGAAKQTSAVQSAASSNSSPANDDCGDAQDLCRQGSYLCGVYRRDFIRHARNCAGVTDSSAFAPAPPSDDHSSDNDCADGQTLCRQGSYLCGVYRRDFIRHGRTCEGVTGPSP